MTRRVCFFAFLALITLADAAAAVSYAYYKQAFKISRPKDNGDYNCYSHLICVQGGGAASPYRTKTAFRVPATWTALPPKATDPEGNPLVANGTLVQFQQDPCTPGACEIDQLHPAPAGQKWVQFVSNEVVAETGDGQAEFIVKYEFVPAPGEVIEGRPVASWLSNDGDDRYGWTVSDQYSEFSISLQVPSASDRALAATAAALAAFGALPLLGRWRRVPEPPRGGEPPRG